MFTLVEGIIVGIAGAMLLLAAYQDFTSWKIRNWLVLVLVGLYGLLVIVHGVEPAPDLLGPTHSGPDLVGDLAAGALLFAIGFALWMFRLMGAGDAKFFFPIGLFVGWGFLLPFALALIAGAVFAAVLLKFPLPVSYQVYRPVARMEEIRSTGKVPYGVVMAGAALFAMYARYVA